MMTLERLKALELGAERFTQEELEANWHFCPEYDEAATTGEQRTPDGACAWCGYKYIKPEESNERR